MLKRMILINSANFQFADIDLSKEVFFVGDNASGKTTTTRALHFLYNGDGKNLGIPSGKDSFSRHYFPHDDSYIIYVFETFFIFTYKRNDTIKRWFSKQEFDINNVVKNRKLLSFKDIEDYIKSASLKIKPQNIEEYTAILYGSYKKKKEKYLDFAIAEIDNHEIFIDVFNMIFNIDKAIVTASDIKKAIQKSLDQKDEVLNINYDDFIQKLNKFSRSYHFFKIFDSSRLVLANALSHRDELISMERDMDVKRKAINYRHQLEIEEMNQQKIVLSEIADKLWGYKDKTKSFEFYYEAFDTRVSYAIRKLSIDVIKLENLKEKFDPLDVEENTLLASKYDGINKELDNKKYSFQKLKEKQTSAQKELENQIEQIEFKIKTTIPNQAKQAFYNLSELENSSHENEALEIDAEYEKFEDELKGKLKELENFIKTLKYNENKIDLEILEQKEISKGSYEGKIKLIEAQKEVKIKAIFSLEKKLKTLQSNRVEHASKCRKHEERYLSLRESNAKILASRRRDLNENILNARAIAYPIENSFNEFLSDEIDGWEKEIYPIIDKNLLKMSCSELHPEVIDSKNPLGFKINVDALDTIPTKDEALEIIKRYKTEKNEILKNSKEVYRNEIGKLDEKKNRLLSDLEVCDKEIENAIDEKVNLVAEEEKNSHIISALIEELKGELISISDKYKNKREKIYKELDEFNTRVNTCNNDIKMNKTNKREKITKSANNRNFNIDLLKKSETKKAQDVIKIEENKIEDLKASMESMSEDEMIDELSKEIGTLKEAFFKSSDAKRYLKEYEDTKPMITQLPSIQAELTKKEKISANRKEMIKRLGKLIAERTSELNIKKAIVEKMLTKYNQGLNKIKELDLDISEDKIATEEMLIDLIIAYENTLREYGNKKSKLRGCIDRLKKLEPHSLIELNLNLDGFGETESIAELENIMDSLGELENFEKNKYESIKKQNHNDFSTFLRSTIPGKLQSFDDLESRFEKAKSSMNKTLSHADFGVIKEIRLITDSSKARNNSIASLLQDLSKKTKDTVNLYSSKSLFYQDIPKSVENIRDIQDILEEIKKKGSSGAINLFDTIDLSMSYIENGKKVENKLNIKNESSSGGNILLKVAIAMSILSRYVKTISKESPFFLIIDEISKLQSKNQDLIREYINENGFKTLFITPDPAYPDPERAIYYTFKNIQEDGEMLEIRQMNII